jgi:2-haloacid dehalogenase
VTDRWATFDCYGTLIDWNAGIRAELARVFGDDEADERLARYHALEPELQRSGTRSYRAVMTDAMRELGATAEQATGLAASLPTWRPFPEARASLEEAKARGWRLAILSNSDGDLIEQSKAALGVAFDETIVASEIGSYKPAHGHWDAFLARTDADPDAWVHVAASHFHDIVPASAIGLPTIWINRLAEQGDPAPARELPSLRGLADVLDALVPA